MKLNRIWKLILVAYLFAITPIALGELDAEGCNPEGCESFCEAIDHEFVGCKDECAKCECESISIPGGGGVCTS